MKFPRFTERDHDRAVEFQPITPASPAKAATPRVARVYHPRRRLLPGTSPYAAWAAEVLFAHPAEQQRWNDLQRAIASANECIEGTP